MASVDVEWPSENEDFDAVTEKARRKNKETDDFDEIEQGSDEPTSEESSDDPIEAPAESAQSTSEEDELLKDNSLDEHSELQHEHEPSPSHGHASAISRLLAEAVLVAAVVGLGLWAWSLHSDNDNLRSQVSQLSNDPQSTIKKQSDALISKVGALMQLPADETPTIANVSDVEAAKKQSAFFTNAQNGDKVLLYAKAGQAILYRPSTNKIVLVAPLTFSNSATNSTPTTTNTTGTNKAVTGSSAQGTTTTTKSSTAR